MTEQEHIVWFQRMAKRVGWPTTGHWMVAPDGDGAVLVHGETMRHIPMSMDKEETLESIAEFFRKVFPNAQVAAPTAMSTSEER